MSPSPHASPVVVPSSDPPKDEELLARTANGDREAFDLLVARHRDAVHRWVCSLTSDDDRVDDVLQETFISAYRYAHTFRGGAEARTWLFTIARNQLYRSANKTRHDQASDAQSLERLGRDAGWGSPPDPEQVVSESERRAQLRAALERLPTRDREVIVARDLSGLTGPETAQILGTSLPAMKARLHRARLRLVAELRSGGDHDGA